MVTYEFENCPKCQRDLRTVRLERLEKRQVFDIPPLRMEVTEHQVPVKQCAGCGTEVKASFPKGIDNSVQYGERLKAQIAYLSGYQWLPTARLVELLADFYGQRLSEDPVLGVLATLSETIQPSLAAIKSELLAAEVAHGDETGMRVAAKTHWLQVLSTPKLTYYAIQAKRGQEALRSSGLLPQFCERLVHDAFAAYFVFEQCQHALCKAHILGELTFIFEEQAQVWAGELKSLLITLKKAVAVAQEQARLEPEQIETFTETDSRLIEAGRPANPPLTKPLAPKRGRLKRSQAQNLLQRLAKYQASVLAFIHDFRVSFDNNLAEPDLRMMKVKPKISDAFRTWAGAETFAMLRSYISTVRKQGLNPLDAIQSALLGQPFIPSPSLTTE